MCSPEEVALLRLEEVFSATLARVNSLVLQPLLEAAPEPSDPWGRECLQQLHRSSQQLRKVTKESLHSLQERLRHPDSKGLESLLLLHSADCVLQVHLEYIEAYTSCVVVQAFQKAANRRSEYWRGQRKALRQLLAGMSSEGSVGTALVQALGQLLTHHVQQYVLLLLSLGDTVGEHHRTRELVVHAATIFVNLQSFMRQELDQAMATQALWHTLSSRLRDVLCTRTRRLLQDSQDMPMVVTPLRAERVLLFDDALVLLQGHNVHTFDLKLVWVEPGQDGCVFHLLTPEEDFSFCSKDPQGRVVWQWKVTQAVCQALRGKKDFPVLGAGLEPSEPPTSRCGAYTFRAEGRFCQATYEGEWYWGRPHGKGTLKWPDGQNHVGDFCQGLEHGAGSWDGHVLREAGPAIGDPPQVQHQRGVQGLLPGGPAAWIWGPRERPTGPSALQVHGPLGEGPEEWLWRRGGQRQGPGILLSEDDSLYEGTFTRDLTLVGKGKVTFPNGFTLEGSFGSGAGRGLHTQGVLDTAALPPDPSSTCKRQLGLGVFPMESRWQGVYGPFWDFVRAGCPGDLQEALLGFHVQSSRELRKSQEHLCCERTHPEDHVGRMEDILEELLQHREPKALQQYLRKALSNSLHPLGKLLQTLMLTFQATYAGIGANKHLQGLAQEEVKQHAQELWAAYRGLLQVALQRKGQALEEDEDAETRDLQVHRLVLPLMLPSFYSELFTLYLLLHEREDSLYSQGIANLSLFPDTKLLEFLDVQKSLRSIDTARVEGMNTLSPPTPGPLCLKAPVALQGPHTDEQSEIFPRQRQVLPVSHRVSAEDDPSCCSTTVDPREKLEVLERTYGEIEATVSRVLGQEHKLPMDDLLPLLIYVVSRAQIQHLGAEIHLIRDMMDSTHTGGRYDFLLTALESCYEHIQKEDMGLHRLPSRWNSRELW
ncbi:ALS2 C-terminal-like protein isoform X9 [Hippopotamus amphibius kiboko]|uniref:ALS2 C-terminal-like protein isoform X9 n=1 Tax=Hippopotamus amphibius kiboko TaxID=575201 RepID=UPI00259911B5|nr:ALS2 C-terminal-like protein isoform X9 [Hippopotamus amphibius kiboko]